MAQLVILHELTSNVVACIMLVIHLIGLLDAAMSRRGIFRLHQVLSHGSSGEARICIYYL